MSKRLFIQAFLSLVVGGVCVAYALHGMDGHAVLGALRALAPASVGLYLATLLVTHLFRTLRWEYLLRALGTSLPFRRLLPISSVGFMAILALPVRLGDGALTTMLDENPRRMLAGELPETPLPR